MAKKTAQQGSSNKVLLVIGAFIVLFFGFWIFHNRQQTLSFEQPVSSLYVLSSYVNTGVQEVIAENSSTVKVVNTFKSSKPSVNFDGHEYQIQSTNGQPEKRLVSLPQNVPVEINVQVGNGSAVVNARDVNAKSAEIAVGNGNLTYVISAKSSYTSDVAVGNGNLILQIPKNIETDGIKLDFGSGAVPDMDLGTLFKKMQTGYQTNGYREAGKNHIIKISGGNVTLRVQSIE